MAQDTGTGVALQYIAGERRHGTSDDLLDVIEPATGKTIVAGLAAGPEDVETAVAAAKAAYADWSRTTPAERSDLFVAWVCAN